jgi:hypothetical protein
MRWILLTVPWLFTACKPDCARDLHFGDPVAAYTDNAPAPCDACCNSTFKSDRITNDQFETTGSCSASYDCADPERPPLQCVEVEQFYVGFFGDVGNERPHNDGIKCMAIVLDGKVVGRYMPRPF